MWKENIYSKGEMHTNKANLANLDSYTINDVEDFAEAVQSRIETIEECIERLKEEIDVLNNTSFDEYLEFKSEHYIEDDILK